jgi:hypothetical protein
MRYHSRVVDSELRQRLSSTGAVVIEGPKACGKTATARNLGASEVLLDAVIQCADGRWGAFEIKLGAGMVEQGAASLLKFVDRVDTDKCGSPSLLAVITGTGYGYMRDDGVTVIPIAALKP